MNDAERKKKPNRSAVPTSVVPVIKAREDILARGSAVLQIDKSNQNIPYPSKTHAASISLAAPYDENFPATQALPASRLATVGSSLGVLRRTYSLSSDEEDDNVYLPPPTQAYAPSKLAQSRSLHTSAGVAASSSVRRSRKLTRSLIKRSPDAARDRLQSSSAQASPHRHNRARRRAAAQGPPRRERRRRRRRAVLRPTPTPGRPPMPSLREERTTATMVPAA